MQSCIITITNWSFNLEQVWMQHMQQQQLHIRLQQPTALSTKKWFSGCFGIRNPGGWFSAVAAMFPNPILMPCTKYCSLAASRLRSLVFFDFCMENHEFYLYVCAYGKRYKLFSSLLQLPLSLFLLFLVDSGVRPNKCILMGCHVGGLVQ